MTEHREVLDRRGGVKLVKLIRQRGRGEPLIAYRVESIHTLETASFENKREAIQALNLWARNCGRPISA